MARTTRRVRSSVGDEAELESYFSGELAGAMGLCSSWSPYGTRVSGATPSEPGGGALAAARAMTRIEETLEQLTAEQRAVLAAAYRPHGPFSPAGLRVLGDVAAIACVLEEPERLRALVLNSQRCAIKGAAAVVPEGDVVSLDAAAAWLRISPARLRRYLLQVEQRTARIILHRDWELRTTRTGRITRFVVYSVDVATIRDLAPELVDAKAVATSAKSELRFIKARARAALGQAREAYRSAAEHRRERARDERRERAFQSANAA